MVTLSQQQGEVVKDIISWYKEPIRNRPEFYLYGYAGTGKSTIVNQAIDELRAHCGVEKVVTAAYTGKAVSVLKNKGISSAQTIHKLLYFTKRDKNGDPVHVRKPVSHNEIGDLIVLDECSMVDAGLARDVRALGKKILIIGDPGQLPPINGSQGFFTANPDAMLTEIHRQAQDSPIIRLATLIRNGEKLPLNFHEGNVIVSPLRFDNIHHLLKKDTQVIAGTHKTRYNYTKRIRANLELEGEMPVAGEKIICCKTNYNHGFFNGFMGTCANPKTIVQDKVDNAGKPYKLGQFYIDAALEDLDEPAKKLLVDPYLFQNHYRNGELKPLEDNTKNYGLYSEFDFGHVITCHKAQGSSWPHVTVIDDSDAFRDNKNKWLYTAITRAESGLTLLSKQYR